MQAMMVAFCSIETIFISDIRLTIVLAVVLIVSSCRSAEDSWVSVKRRVTSCLVLFAMVEQSASNLSLQTYVTLVELMSVSSWLATLSIPSQLALFTFSCWSACLTFSSALRSSLMAGTTSPAVVTREAVASLTEPAAVPVKLRRAETIRQISHDGHYET